MKILAIGAHADDIELGCGGTLAAARGQGHSTRMLIMCDDGFLDYTGKEQRTESEVRDEAVGGALALMASLTMLHFDTKAVQHDADAVEHINLILDQEKPDYILTHWPFDTHQDHAHTSLATISAARNFENILFYEPFPPSGRSYVGFKPQVYVDISQVLDTKVKAIEAHASQVRKYGPEWIESIVGRAKLRGFESNVRYAECFEVLRLSLRFP